MKRRFGRSLTLPITLASVAIPLSIALLVGWTLVVVQNLSLTQQVARSTWLIVLGAVSFAVIMGVLITFAIVLGKEILNVRKQDSFIDSVTHELKSPLASIKLGLETLGRDKLGDDKREMLRAMMLEDVDRLSSFIDDVLTSSRVAYIKTPVALSEFEFKDLIDECVTSVSRRHPRVLESLEVDIDAVDKVHSDRAALAIVVKNLLDNAMKYSDDDPDVRIQASLGERDGIVIEVDDSGIGIPAAEAKKVFQRFYRVGDEEVRARRGTGLGLFVVNSLVRNLGGRIVALPRDSGGTTMRVTLPASQPGRE